jgi:hypothetical protein
MDPFEVLVQELDAAVVGKRDWIASGQAPDYPEYKRICGEIHGLLLARQEILDLKRKMENSDNE